MEPTRLTDVEAIYRVAACAARAVVARAQPDEERALRGAFKRDTTLFGYLSGSPLEHLGVPHRTYAQQTHLPGRAVIVTSERDVPARDALVAFLDRGGTVVAEAEALPRVGELFGMRLAVTAASGGDSGTRPATGPLLDGLFSKTFAPLFWLDAQTHTLASGGNPEAAVVAWAGDKPFVSEWSVGDGRLVHIGAIAPGVAGGDPDDPTITPLELARALGLEPEGALGERSVAASDTALRASVTAFVVASRVLASALG